MTILDVRTVSNVTDYYIIATGKNTPHLRAMVNELERVLDEARVRRHRKAGTPESEWIVADYLDAVVHLFTPRTRGYYSLESLWSDAARVE